MTVQDTSVRKAGPSQGNGANVAFPFTFKVFATSEVVVTYTDAAEVEHVQVLTTNYTVSLNADQNVSPGGTVTMVVAPATGTYITLTSNVLNTQNLQISNAGFYPEAINNALDSIVIQVQQLAEKVARAIKTTVSSTINPDTLVATLIADSASASASASAASSSASAAAASAASIAIPIPIASGGTGATSAGAALSNLGAPALNAVQSWTAQQTFKGVTETVYAITDGAAFEINPANGTIQTITLGASRTPKGTSFAAGHSITLMITAGANAITWTDATFGSGGVKWLGGTAPTLSATVTSSVVLWKVGSQVYGKAVGDA